MSSQRSSEGLSIGYRIGYRLRMLGLTLFGPAQLGESNDPKARLVREREARVARARATRQRAADRD
ncbi:hypothetical protein [Terrabacter sp. MAHUQ-38]|uniref:hypothetical protein n=1 Tax=unclassified Terrabacter TaxID=2630222 RepID=UPI00165D650A|nr:hypothetical protein [Terrabacter sp. MAHUQ-38]MBC9823798.1 hypothetical protein [Terrabacter sp. MAHUQ-38]